MMYGFRVWDNARNEYRPKDKTLVRSDGCVFFIEAERAVKVKYADLYTGQNIELCTGITATNNQLIYENDVIESDTGCRYLVVRADDESIAGGFVARRMRSGGIDKDSEAISLTRCRNNAIYFTRVGSWRLLKPVRMTLKELEKKLGYAVQIVDEE